jgi:hypothetical protein
MRAPNLLVHVDRCPRLALDHMAQATRESQRLDNLGTA